MSKAKVKMDTSKLRELRRQIEGDGLRKVYNQWGAKYLTWIKRRYRKNSKGGGEWQKLSPATLTVRRVLGSSLSKTKTGRKRSAKARSKMRAKLKATFDFTARVEIEEGLLGGKHLGKTATAKILIDTGVLVKSLDIGNPGNEYRRIIRGIRVGFSKKRNSNHRGLTVRQLAITHQKGNISTNLPARPILHIPDEKFRKRMLIDLRKGINELGQSL